MEKEKLTTEQLLSLTARELFTELEQRKNEASQLGVAWAEAQKQHHDIKNMLPSILATLICSFITPTCKLNEARQLALADQRYTDKIKECNEKEALAESLLYQFRLDMAVIEAIRSIAWVRNQEIKIFKD